MAVCRVYLFTYKRNYLLPRAIESLLAQTFTDWICEVHNEDPADFFPGQYVRSLNDARFILCNHEINLGATASFNLAFAGCAETFISILEDDNWWEPDFLKEMISLMNQHPGVSVAWSNMKIWEEKPGNQWVDTKQTVARDTRGTCLFQWPHFHSALGALHSNGAMVCRSTTAKNYVVPADCDFNIMEAVRERTYAFPILLNYRLLANFSRTLSTNRANDGAEWTVNQTMLLASFIEAGKDKEQLFKQTLAYFRHQRPSPAVSFFLANRWFLHQAKFYFCFNIQEWFSILKWHVKNAGKLKSYENGGISLNLYDFLLKNTAARYGEMQKKK